MTETTTLQQAKNAWADAEPGAATLAAIASAEALTRIAEVLETMLEQEIVSATVSESPRIWSIEQ